jgi:hypothetical protein
MLSIFSIFILEIIAFRWGTAKLAVLGIKHGKSAMLSRIHQDSHIYLV